MASQLAFHGQTLTHMIEVFKEVDGISIGTPEEDGWHPMGNYFVGLPYGTTNGIQKLLRDMSGTPIGVPEGM